MYLKIIFYFVSFAATCAVFITVGIILFGRFDLNIFVNNNSKSKFRSLLAVPA
jgi:hypothetical protein